jgi:2-oxoglutarate dehydrogenase E2 component (dihydrolipoamide succinyltransferase)
MAAEIKVPSVGESITEVIVGQWLVAQGSRVEKEQPIALLETDKVNVEVPAPVSGVLSKIVVAENATAKIGDTIGLIEEGATAAAGPGAGAGTGAGAGASSGAGAGSGAGAKSTASNATAPPTNTASMQANAQSAPPRGQASASGSGAPASGAAGFVMPAAQRLAADKHIDPHSAEATGPGGRVLKEDVQRAAQGSRADSSGAQTGATQQGGPPTATPNSCAPGPAAPVNLSAPAAAELTRVVPMSPMRRRIAERLVQAQHTAAILTTFNEVDMTEVMALRKRMQESFVKKNGIKLGFMSFFVRAAVDALRAYPEVNAEVRGTDLVYRNYYDIGVAVGGEKGLVVPVVRRAELLGFAEIEATISDFGKRAGSGKIKLEEMQGGTFTISNGGVYGSLMSTPIINPPQSGILGMHAIVERPIGVQGKIELRPMMYLALSYDHRIVDGRGAVSFLKRIKECVEDPSRMLLEI